MTLPRPDFYPAVADAPQPPVADVPYSEHLPESHQQQLLAGFLRARALFDEDSAAEQQAYDEMLPLARESYTEWARQYIAHADTETAYNPNEWGKLLIDMYTHPQAITRELAELRDSADPYSEVVMTRWIEMTHKQWLEKCEELYNLWDLPSENLDGRGVGVANQRHWDAVEGLDEDLRDFYHLYIADEIYKQIDADADGNVPMDDLYDMWIHTGGEESFGWQRFCDLMAAHYGITDGGLKTLERNLQNRRETEEELQLIDTETEAFLRKKQPVAEFQPFDPYAIFALRDDRHAHLEAIAKIPPIYQGAYRAWATVRTQPFAVPKSSY